MVYKKNKTRRGLNKKRKQRTRKNSKISKITSKITSEIKKSLKNIQFGGDDTKHGQVGGAGGNVILIGVDPNATHDNENGVALTFFVKSGIVAPGEQNQQSSGNHNADGDGN